MKETNPPLVRSAVTELVARGRILAGQLKQDEKKNLQTALELGRLLEQIKEGLPHGEYVPAVEKMGLSRFRAAGLMSIAKCAPVHISKCESINDALKVVRQLANDDDAEPDEEPEEDVPTVPEPLNDVFKCVKPFRSAIREAKALAKVFKELEQSPAYVRVLHGTKQKDFSSYIKGAADLLHSITPKQACEGCKGNSCEACGGKGYLTNEDLG